MNGHERALAAMPWAGAVPQGSLDWLADSVEEVTFEPGDVFITQGDTDRDCYFLVSGDVEVMMNGQVAGTSGPGEPEGEMALLYRRPRGGTVTAIQPVRALMLKASDFDELVSTDPDSARVIAGAIIEHLAARFGWRPPEWTPPDNGGS